MIRKVNSGHTPQERRQSRKFALQALYQWQMTKMAPSQVEAEFVADNDLSKIDREYFSEVLRGVPAEVEALDEHIVEVLDRPIAQLTPIELAILRMGAYEFLHRIDVPYKVIINEGVDLSKKFGANEAHKYVNGVLDKLARKLRMNEIKR